MAKAKMGDVVKIHYTGKLDDGSVFDTSKGRDPFQVKLGEHQILPVVEEEIVGMKPGDEKTVDVPAVKAFGLYNKELVQVVERTQLPADLEIEVNEPLEIKLKDGQKIVARVADATEKTVTLDANHPLAGENLIYDIKLIDIL